MSPQDFTTALLAEFPDLHSEVEQCSGDLHGVMEAFAIFTRGAKGRGDWPAFDRCVVLADQLLVQADGTLASAFRTSYLEHLDFEGSRGPEAWRRFSPPLQAAWEQIAAANRRLMGLPQKSSLAARPQQGSHGHPGGGQSGRPRNKKKSSSRKGPRGRRR